MYRTEIKLRPGQTNKPLEPVWVGTGSAALFILLGVPKGFTARLYLIRPGKPPLWFDATQDGASRAVHCGGANFPSPRTDHRYEVTITDPAAGQTYWCGSGNLTILPAAGGNATEGLGNALETYIRNPATGLYHLVTAEINEDGDVTSKIAQQGITLS